MARCSLTAWTLDSREEPVIRVAMLLPEDGMDSILLKIPSRGYLVSGGDGPGQMFRSVMAKVTVENRRVSFLSEGGVAGPAEVIKVSPEEPVPQTRGVGVQLRGVVAGRGFHWEKRIHPTVGGMLEFRASHGRLVVVNELPLEDYLPGVIAGEMSGDCPLEFLKSQTVVARAWVLAHTEKKHTEYPVDRCNDDCCQRYHGTTDLTERAVDAVRQTRGQVLIDRKKTLIDANYSKSCGRIIESPQHVWFVQKAGQRATVDAPTDSEAHRFFPLSDDLLMEYLTGDWLKQTDVFCSPNVVPEKSLPSYLSKIDEGGGHFRWRVDYDRHDLEKILRDKFFSRQDPSKVAFLDTLLGLRVCQRGDSGRAKDLEIEYLDPMGVTHKAHVVSEYTIREVLHEKFLFSSAFVLEIQRDPAGVPRRISLIGGGWGHGAGLCQIGALGMALRGYKYEAILKHYFEDVQLHECY